MPSNKSSQNQFAKSISDDKKLTASPELKSKISQTLINSLKTTTPSMSNKKVPDLKVFSSDLYENKHQTFLKSLSDFF